MSTTGGRLLRFLFILEWIPLGLLQDSPSFWYLNHSCQIFDVYEGEHIQEGKKSIAISVTYSSDDHTLTEKEITEMENRIKFELTKQFHAELRA